MLKEKNSAQQEFEEFLTEMNDLIQSGVLSRKCDFQLWLEEVEDECNYCFKELSEFVEEHIQSKVNVNKIPG